MSTMVKNKFILCTAVWGLFFLSTRAQQKEKFRVIAYYAGSAEFISQYEIEKESHLIYCFGQLKGNELHFGHRNDTIALQSMAKLKLRNPDLKIMFSLGGWGGCKTCSEVFSLASNRRAFAKSVKVLADFFKVDGIDLDWEYPAIQGYPGFRFDSTDKDHFTELLHEMRTILGPKFEISFAAGGFSEFLQHSIHWKQVIKSVDFINLMSYDLVHGYSKWSGHHTPLYSTPYQKESTNHAVQWLLSQGVPSHQLVIGAALYGRFFRIDEGHPVNLYQPCRFSHSFSSKHASDSLSESNGFIVHWDSTAHAPYAINNGRRMVASYDDERSITAKVKYAKEHQLGGIMFWQLWDDSKTNGLLNIIHQQLKK